MPQIQSLARSEVHPAFNLLQRIVAQDAKCPKLSQVYHEREERPRQLVRLEFYMNKISVSLHAHVGFAYEVVNVSPDIF